MSNAAADMIRFNCLHCGGKVNAPRKGAGRKVRCPKCQNAITIPAAAGEPPAPAEPAPSHFDLDVPDDRGVDLGGWSPEPAPPQLADTDDVPTFAAWPPPPRVSPPPAPVAVRPTTKAFPIDPFLNFDLMISTIIIRCLWLLGAIVITFGPFVVLVWAFVTEPAPETSWGGYLGLILAAFLVAVLAAFLGNVVWRLICESVILLFKTHETLTELLAEARRP